MGARLRNHHEAAGRAGFRSSCRWLVPVRSDLVKAAREFSISVTTLKMNWRQRF